jgi:hypothetical protein
MRLFSEPQTPFGRTEEFKVVSCDQNDRPTCILVRFRSEMQSARLYWRAISGEEGKELCARYSRERICPKTLKNVKCGGNCQYFHPSKKPVIYHTTEEATIPIFDRALSGFLCPRNGELVSTSRVPICELDELLQDIEKFNKSIDGCESEMTSSTIDWADEDIWEDSQDKTKTITLQPWALQDYQSDQCLSPGIFSRTYWNLDSDLKVFTTPTSIRRKHSDPLLTPERRLAWKASLEWSPEELESTPALRESLSLEDSAPESATAVPVQKFQLKKQPRKKCR